MGQGQYRLAKLFKHAFFNNPSGIIIFGPIFVRFFDTIESPSSTAAESPERLQRELEVLRSEDKERTASTKRLESLLTEQKNDNASVRKILSEKEECLTEMESNVESLNARVSSDAGKIRELEGSLAEKARDLDALREKLTDEVAQKEELVKENEHFEVLCTELKSQKDLLKSENEKNREAMEDMHMSFVTLKDSLQGDNSISSKTTVGTFLSKFRRNFVGLVYN